MCLVPGFVRTDTGEVGIPYVDGIVIAAQMSRVWWADGIVPGSGDSVPPTCSSDDGARGHIYADSDDQEAHIKQVWGIPDDGDCSQCSLSQLGSSDRGRGSACRPQGVLWMLLNGEATPVRLRIPPTGLKNLNPYIRRIGGHYYLPERISRVQWRQHNAGGINVGAHLTKLTQEQIESARAAQQAWLPQLERFGVSIDLHLTPQPQSQRGDASPAITW